MTCQDFPSCQSVHHLVRAAASKKIQLGLLMFFCKVLRTEKPRAHSTNIIIVIQNILSMYLSAHRVLLAILVMLDVTGSITFTTASPDSFMSVKCAQYEPALVYQENRAQPENGTW